MDDDNSDHMTDDQDSADPDAANFYLRTTASNSTKDDSVGCFRSHTGTVLVCMLMIVISKTPCVFKKCV